MSKNTSATANAVQATQAQPTYPYYGYDVETLKNDKKVAHLKRTVDGGKTWQPAASKITISNGMHAGNYVSVLNEYTKWKATGKPDWMHEPDMHISFGTRSDGSPKHAEFTIYYSNDNLSMPFWQFKSYRQAESFLSSLKKDLTAEGWKGNASETGTPDEIKLKCYEDGLKNLDHSIINMKDYKQKYAHDAKEKAETQKDIDGLRKIRYNFVKELRRLEKACGKKVQSHQFKMPEPKDKSNAFAEGIARMFSGNGCCWCSDANKDKTMKVNGNVATFTDWRDGDVYQVTVKRIALKSKK